LLALVSEGVLEANFFAEPGGGWQMIEEGDHDFAFSTSTRVLTNWSDEGRNRPGGAEGRRIRLSLYRWVDEGFGDIGCPDRLRNAGGAGCTTVTKK